MKIRAEDLVGTIVNSETLLVRFLGEGKDSVVYEEADPLTKRPTGLVVKLSKSEPFLELSVLHHRFRVHADWHHHALRMGTLERAQRLEVELIERLKSRQLPFRCALLRCMYQGAISRLGEDVRFSLEDRRRDESGEVRSVMDLSPPRIATVVRQRIFEDEGLIPLRDTVLREFLEEALDEGGLEETDELVILSAREALASVPAHRTVVDNVLVGAIALLDEDFIDEDEFTALMKAPAFQRLIHAADILMLRDVLRVWLCMLARARLRQDAMRAHHVDRLAEVTRAPFQIPGWEHESGLEMAPTTLGVDVLAPIFEEEARVMERDCKQLEKSIKLGLHVFANFAPQLEPEPAVVPFVEMATRWATSLPTFSREVFTPNQLFRVWNPYFAESAPIIE